MIDIRCMSTLHAKVDPEAIVWEVKCDKCTRRRGVVTFHRWTWEQIQQAQAQGRDVVWPCLTPEGDSSTN